MQRWIWSHWDDAVKVLKKPLVFAEFGKSKKDPGYTEGLRDAYLGAVYADIYRLARTGGGSISGGLVWQLMAEGMDSYYDGYEIVLSRDASTNAVLVRQSHAMLALASTMNEAAATAAVKAGGDGNGAAAAAGRKHGGGHVRRRKHAGQTHFLN